MCETVSVTLSQAICLCNCFSNLLCTCETVSVTLSQATCLCAISDFMYIATTSGSLVIVDSNLLSVATVCQPCTQSDPHITDILHLATDQSPPTDLSRDQPTVSQRRSMLATIGRGYRDLVRRTVPQYNTTMSTCDSYVLLVWSDSEWISHGYQQLNV